MNRTLNFDNVCISIGNNKLAEHLNVSLVTDEIDRNGGIVGIAGASGIGKSSLVRMLVDERFRNSCLISGSIHYDPSLRFALLPQKPVLVENDSVEKNLNLFSKVKSRKAWVDADLMSEYTMSFGVNELEGRKKSDGLSGGEAQRIMLVRTLGLNPDVLILDEPFVGIDALSKSKIA